MKMAVVQKLCDIASPTSGSERKKNALHKICNNDPVAMVILTSATQINSTAEEATKMIYNSLL